MQLLEIPSGMQGLYLKLQAMRDLVLKGTTDQRIIKAVYELIKDVPARNKQKEAEKILNYIRKNIRYLEDPVSVELIKSTPRLLLEYKQGDCVPVWQKIIVKNKSTNTYELKEIGGLRKDYDKYDALSYNFGEKRWEFNPITNYIDKGKKPVYRVHLTGGREFYCTENHICYFCEGRDNGIVEKTLLEIYRLFEEKNKGRSRNPFCTVYPIKILIASKIPTLDTIYIDPHEAWLYGIYAAEGYQNPDEKRVAIAQDKPLVKQKIREHLDFLKFKYSESKRQKNGYFRIGVDFSSKFREFGSNSFNKQIPPIYFSSNLESLNHLLDGIKEGDAWIVSNSKSKGESIRLKSRYLEAVYATSSDKLKDDILFLGLLTGRAMSHFQQIYYKIPRFREFIWRISEFINGYRKKINTDLAIGYIDEIDLIGEEDVCDITVDSTHNFVTNTGIILHNCDCQSTLLATMLNIVGIPTRFIAIKTILDNDYSHVYVEADIHRVGMYYSMDTTVEKPIGWESKLIEEKAYIDNKDGRIWTERKGDSMARLGDSLMILDGLKQVGWLQPVNNLRRSSDLSQAELGTVIDTIGTIITNVLVSLSEQKTPQWYQKFSEEVNKLNTILQQVPEAQAKMRQIIEDSKKSTIEKWITNPISWVVGGIAIVLGLALVSKK